MALFGQERKPVMMVISSMKMHVSPIVRLRRAATDSFGKVRRLVMMVMPSKPTFALPTVNLPVVVTVSSERLVYQRSTLTHVGIDAEIAENRFAIGTTKTLVSIDAGNFDMLRAAMTAMLSRMMPVPTVALPQRVAMALFDEI